ncbi:MULTISPECIES: ABC transporter permease [unclassified Thermotoga]|uniref:ABC transporter permease n=1 Tax=unclassified Thermotoga TaxID=2631113 RepID=UPI000280E900|nr:MULTISPECIES: ABC transporter permease [unclassified Thermotoga]AIY86052.1 binding-protein-dependent transport systems inner membrane component [Thermotoga sp. 2812B]EJX27040.1 binding-protein-dependent transport systems inner membrane component [Thermotoga sp. EMP]
MLGYIMRRLVNMIITLLVISVIVFTIIQLPPGDFLTAYIAYLQSTGEEVDQATIDALRKQYGLDLPVYAQYFKWLWGILHGDFGYSFYWNKPVNQLLWGRLGMSVVVSTIAIVFSWVTGFVIGMYSATHQYSLGDYLATLLGYIGLATPNFLLALILLWLAYSWAGVNLGGLFSQEYINAPWSFAKFVDMLKHLWVPMVVVGTAGMAGLIRTLRANLLDELHKPYVEAALSKGLPERYVFWKYPMRIAMIPFISTVGWTIPRVFSGETITAIVLNLPTVGPLLYGALMSQDMYLAGSLVMFLSFFTVLGTLISDILLAWVDPRIRFE